MMIPMGWRAEYTTAKVMRKYVKCAQCGCEYFYFMERSAHAEARGPLLGGAESVEQDAKDTAYAKLHKKLIEEVEPAQCPDCGWYETKMVSCLKERASRKWKYAMIASLLLVIPTLCVYLNYNDYYLEHTPHRRVSLAIAGLLITLAMCLGGLWLLAWSKCDPNAGYPQTRPAPATKPPETIRKTDWDTAQVWYQKEWYLAMNGESQGPLSAAELLHMLRDGQITPGDLICKQEGEWYPIHRFKALTQAATARSHG